MPAAEQASFQSTLLTVLSELKTILSAVEEKQADALAEEIRLANRVYLAGAGRSRLMLCAFAMRLMHLGLTVLVVGEVTAPAIGKNDLLIVASGSGETVSMRNVAQKAKAAGARVALLTASPSSALARDAHLRVVLPANTSGPSVQIGASAFEQSLLLLGDALIVLLADKLHIADPQSFMRSRHANWE